MRKSDVLVIAGKINDDNPVCTGIEFVPNLDNETRKEFPLRLRFYFEDRTYLDVNLYYGIDGDVADALAYANDIFDASDDGDLVNLFKEIRRELDNDKTNILPTE